MARKSGRTTNAGASATPASSTNDHDSSHKQSQKQPRIEQPGNGFTNTTTNHPTQAKGPLANTHRSSCSAEEGNEGSSDDDAAKADGEDDEDAQSDALAPSGRTTKESGDQAGHLVAEFEKHAPIEKSLNNGGGGPEIRRPTPKEAGVSRRTAATESEGCDSDKEAYDGVDDISDTDEGEPDVEKLEEKRIIELAEGGDAVSEAGASDIWEGFEIDNGLFMSDVPYFDEQYGRTDQGILDSEMELFQNTSVFDDLEEPIPSLPQPKLPPRRRVHFREPVLPPWSETSDVISDDEDLNGLFNSSLGQDTEGGQTLSRVRQGNSEDEDEDDSSGGNSSGYESGFI